MRQRTQTDRQTGETDTHFSLLTSESTRAPHTASHGTRQRKLPPPTLDVDVGVAGLVALHNAPGKERNVVATVWIVRHKQDRFGGGGGERSRWLDDTKPPRAHCSRKQAEHAPTYGTQGTQDTPTTTRRFVARTALAGDPKLVVSKLRVTLEEGEEESVGVVGGPLVAHRVVGLVQRVAEAGWTTKEIGRGG